MTSTAVTAVPTTAGDTAAGTRGGPERAAAVLWDMDGTIVDTEPFFTAAVEDLVAAAGGTLTAGDRVALVGANLWDVASIVRRAGVRRTREQVVSEVSAAVRRRLSREVPWQPGARELLAGLRHLAVPTALVTMSFRDVAEAVVAGIGFDAFDVVVTGDEVSEGKPDPEAYLRAAALLGVGIHRCVVVEDSPPGVAAGIASGATVVAVPRYLPLPASADCTRWETLTGHDASDLLDVTRLRAPSRAGVTHPRSGGER